MQAARFMTSAFVACACALGAGADSGNGVSARGYRGVQVGVTVDAATKAFGAPLEPLREVADDERSCFCVYPDGVEGPVSFMVVEGRVARVDVDGTGPRTAAGIGVGSLESEVHDAYPDRVTASPHKYVEGHYLTVEQSEGSLLIFETDGNRVTSYRAGKLPAVRWIEGCS